MLLCVVSLHTRQFHSESSSHRHSTSLGLDEHTHRWCNRSLQLEDQLRGEQNRRCGRCLIVRVTPQPEIEISRSPVLRHRYTLLSAVQMAYIYFVEGNTVFVGKRKT